MPDGSNKIELPYVRIEYIKPIVYFDYKEGTELGFPEIQELIACAEKLSGHQPYVTFSDVRAGVNITNQGKRYVSNLENMPLFRGTAALVENSFYKFAANFFNPYSKYKYPFKAFTDKDEAVKWLLSLPLD